MTRRTKLVVAGLSAFIILSAMGVMAAYLGMWLSRVQVRVIRVPVTNMFGYVSNFAVAGDAVGLQEVLGKDPSLATLSASDGVAPLHYAAYADCGPCVELLIRYGADVNQVSKGETSAGLELGGTPLHVAIRHESWDAVAALRQNGARDDIADHSGVTPEEMMRDSENGDD